MQCAHSQKHHKKCQETGTPWRLGLLKYLCTPLDENTPSPSNLIGCQFKGLCPTFSSLQESQEGTLKHLIEKCLCEKLYHDKKSRTLADIPTGSTAAVLVVQLLFWITGQIPRQLVIFWTEVTEVTLLNCQMARSYTITGWI